MRQLPLSASVQVVLDASGSGYAETGPLSPAETWLAGFCAAVRTQETAITSEALCRVYVGGRFIGGTTWGSTGDSSTGTPQVSVGQVVRAEWTGGDHGATAVLDITGTKQVA